MAKKRTTIVIDAEVHALGVALAKAERRDFSNFVEVVIERLWEKRQTGPESTEKAGVAA